MSTMTRWASATRDLIAAMAWRGYWKAEDAVRAALWSNRLGFERRSRPAGTVARVDVDASPAVDARFKRMRSQAYIVIGESETNRLAEVGDFYGLDVQRFEPAVATQALARAIAGLVPMVAVGGREPMPTGWAAAARAYVQAGGSLYIEAGDEVIGQLGAELETALPRQVPLEPGAAVIRFSARARSFAHELAGVAIAADRSVRGLSRVAGGTVLATLTGEGRAIAVLHETQLGEGRVVVSSAAGDPASLRDAFDPLDPVAALAPMMLVRQLYGDAAWHAPGRFANFVVDDPALREGRLGLDYPRALASAKEHGFHLTVATIPSELRLSQSPVVQMLRVDRRWLSACYHGNDHSGYEFFLTAGSRMRYRTRSLAAQDRALQKAVASAETFAARTGLALDRVMVFPNGVGSAEVLASLQRLGFIAACNYDDRYPLGAPVPDDFDLGLRPADLAWAGFPLMWRRGWPDPMFAVDLFLGRPVITFAHPKAVGPDFGAFGTRADDLNGLAQVQWSGLEDISRHSYLQREDMKDGWQVLMTSNEICLHNPDPLPRTYSIARRHMPAGSFLTTDGLSTTTRQDTLEVRVQGGGRRTVRVAHHGMTALSPGTECTLAEPPARLSTA